MQGDPEVGLWSSVMKTVWGTDTRCTLQAERQHTDDMLAEAERKVQRLHETLDNPPRNIDEAMYEMSRRRG